MASRHELTLVLLGWVLALSISAIAPTDTLTWFLEVSPVMIAGPLIWVLRDRFPLSRVLLWAAFIHGLILILGGHYTYAEVPLGFWIQDAFDLARNPYDRVGHFWQGFVPALLAREILLRTTSLGRGRMLFFVCVSIALAFSAFYEMVEWWAAVALGQGADDFLGTQGDQWDTQWDMFMAMIGAVTGQVLCRRVQDRQLQGVVR